MDERRRGRLMDLWSFAMTRRSPTDTEILAQIPAARAREAVQRRKGLRATDVRFDRKAQRIVLELASGYLFAFPVRAIPALRAMSSAQLAAVDLHSSGISLRWDAQDVDLSVAGVLLSAIGEKEQRRQLASLAGRVSSAAKAKAARTNGAKGGRPKGRKAAALNSTGSGRKAADV